MTAISEPPTLFAPDVDVRVSKRRKKSVVAYWEGDRIVVVVPAHMRGAVRDEWVHDLVARVRRHRPHLHASDELLMERAVALGAAYFDGVVPASIRWVTNQRKRWGSCTMLTREIRISTRLRVVPEWVLDAVIVHELAHLLEAHHTPRFRALENRYPRRHDADVYLAGFGLGLDLQGSDEGAADGSGPGSPATTPGA